MTVHPRAALLILGLGLVAVGLSGAQPTVTVQQVPGKPPQVTLPMAPPPTQGVPTATVTPGPDPWYTVLGTGEVVGYIEPCG